MRHFFKKNLDGLKGYFKNDMKNSEFQNIQQVFVRNNASNSFS